MSLVQMTLSGGMFILFIVAIRALALHRLPKGVFLALWEMAALRLPLPFTIPLPFSADTPMGRLLAEQKLRRPLVVGATTAIAASPKVEEGEADGTIVFVPTGFGKAGSEAVESHKVEDGKQATLRFTVPADGDYYIWVKNCSLSRTQEYSSVLSR